MKQKINSVVQHFFNVNELSSLPIERLQHAQAEAPYTAIFPLLEILHPASNNTKEKKWINASIHANNLLWWQFIEVAMDDDKYELKEKIIENIQIEEKEEVKIIVKEVNTEKIEEEVSESISYTLSKIKESLNIPVEHTNVWVDLEPYHTVDYFASQGIKIGLDVEPKDKLGKQLKSFTQWLKTMRRIGPTPENVLIDNETEQQVITNAAHSIAKDEIVTETMADVLEKQGKIGKAIEVYKQLSILYPEKSVYFAAKIKQIKA